MAFAAAVLTRETTLAVLGGMGVWQVAAGLRGGWAALHPRLRRAAWLLVPLAVGLAWQVWVYQVWHALPVRSNGGNVGAPVIDVVRSLFLGADNWLEVSKDTVVQHAVLVERLLLAALFGYIAWSLLRTRLPADLRAGWVVAAVLALSVRGWPRDEQFLRAANEAISMGLLVVFARPLRDRGVGVVLFLTAGVSCVVAMRYALT